MRLRRRPSLLLLFVVAPCAAASAQTSTQDYPQWRGRNRDGAASGAAPPAWPEKLPLRWKVDVGDGPDLDIKGNVVDHEYEIEVDDHKIAEISKKWFRVRDTYGVQIAPGQDPLLILAVTIAVDAMVHPDR